jgi:hypothetical protein
MQATLSQFVEQLFAEGRVAVPVPATVGPSEIAAAEAVLAGQEAVLRLDLPGVPPPLLPSAASWAAVSLYHACQFVVFRDAGQEAIAAALKTPCPNGDAASLHYSVDLCFRFLPDLVRMVRSAAENDPLLGYLKQWAVAWPLSSVGMPGVESPRIDAIVNHPCLLGVYRDRIITRRDRSRLGDPRVQEAVCEAVGEDAAAEWRIPSP